ncbi:MAG: DUF4405 domain-containing protein [Pyrobaculum sp.]|uniref:DUF4405 domain-containing protein n=1 Tax=Pyrobaculum sp. TaxID=2004705 RepID=UPI003CA71669
MSWFIRAVVIYLLATAGIMLALSGLVLYFAPSGPGSGHQIILGATKDMWKNIHTYAAFSILAFAAAHVVLNRRSLIFYIKKTAKPPQEK